MSAEEAAAGEGENGENPEDMEEEVEDAEEGRDPLEQVWAYGLNDAIKIQEENIAAKSGNFFEDFLNCCEEFRLIPYGGTRCHPAMSKEKVPGAIVCKGLLLDLCSVKLMRHLLPTSQTLEHLKFTNCKLDAEMVGLLTDALAEERTTIKTLVLDWNQLELPLEIPEDVTELPSLEKLEIGRYDAQGRRDVQLWIELVLEATGKSNMKQVIQLLHQPWAPSASRRDLRRVNLATDAIDYAQFCYHFGSRIGVPLRDDVFRRAFAFFDGPLFGGGMGSFKLEVIERGCEGVPTFDEKEGPDAVGLVWKRLIETSFIESLSCRCSGLSRLEAPILAEGLKGQVYLRQLNLYGNNLSDMSAARLAPALADNSMLEYLGLGDNSITEVGLKALCEYAGAVITEDRTEADERIAQQSAATLPPPSRDGAGNERRQREAPHVDGLIEIPPPDENTPPKYYWFRNKSLLHLNLSSNRIKDLAVVEECLQLGRPSALLVIKGNPVVEMLNAAGGYHQPAEDAELGWMCDYGQPTTTNPSGATSGGGGGYATGGEGSAA